MTIAERITWLATVGLTVGLDSPTRHDDPVLDNLDAHLSHAIATEDLEAMSATLDAYDFLTVVREVAAATAPHQ